MTSGSYAHCRIFSPKSMISLSPRAPFLAPPRQMWLRQATHFVCWFFFFMNSSLSQFSAGSPGWRSLYSRFVVLTTVGGGHSCVLCELWVYHVWLVVLFSFVSFGLVYHLIFSFSFSFPSLADTLDQHVKTLELLPWLLGQKLPGNPTSVIPETKQMTSPVSSKILPLYEQEAVEGLTVQVTDEFSLNSDQAR